ncbi:hypothetical protein [Phyllobacterium lublinensis]|uniref:hypothetical protein n=1 Tax=Phyllobacterium lublinensis TaxID=2875708 RepID=UPI001CCDD85C|nr:hypothetical protein [Phyllobacterium sp. 2063]MBZ9653556.1 hypothetical protein [Phyllobacterium sp. 2063]
MVNRIVVGEHPTWGMGAFVSKPGIDAISASKFDFMFSTMYENMQIHQTGSFTMNGTYGAYTTFSWPDLGYFPLIMLASPLYEIQLEYLSTAAARVRRLAFGETFSGITTESNAPLYYVVLKTQLP